MRIMRLVTDDEMEGSDVKELNEVPAEPEKILPTEQQDGPVEDAAEDAGADEQSATVSEVDLSTLEALLFSTHHPLTAGRLAELLEIDTTKALHAPSSSSTRATRKPAGLSASSR